MGWEGEILKVTGCLGERLGTRALALPSAGIRIQGAIPSEGATLRLFPGMTLRP